MAATQQSSSPPAESAGQPTPLRCSLCSVRFDSCDTRWDRARGICGDCRQHPQARGLVTSKPPRSAQGTAAPRDLTVADKSFIAKSHGYLPLSQLLSVLNERLAADLGPKSIPYSIDQIKAYVSTLGHTASPVGRTSGGDWASMRKLIERARREGVLEEVTEQVIDDFAVVYSLNQAQVLHLKEVISAANDGDETA